MKKLISILLFSAICLGTKALGSDPTIIRTWGAHHMDVTIENNKKYSFEDKDMTFSAYNINYEAGIINIMLEIDNPEAYKKLKQMMNEIQTKIKVTLAEVEGYDKNGIYHCTTKTGSKWNGYVGTFLFQWSDIELIELY